MANNLENIDPSTWGEEEENDDEDSTPKTKKSKVDKSTKDAILLLINQVESKYKNKHAPGVELAINIVKRFLGVKEELKEDKK